MTHLIGEPFLVAQEQSQFLMAGVEATQPVRMTVSGRGTWAGGGSVVKEGSFDVPDRADEAHCRSELAGYI